MFLWGNHGQIWAVLWAITFSGESRVLSGHYEKYPLMSKSVRGEMQFIRKIWSKFQAMKFWQKIITIVLILSVIGAFTGPSESSDSSNTVTTQSEKSLRK